MKTAPSPTSVLLPGVPAEWITPELERALAAMKATRAARAHASAALEAARGAHSAALNNYLAAGGGDALLATLCNAHGRLAAVEDVIDALPLSAAADWVVTGASIRTAVAALDAAGVRIGEIAPLAFEAELAAWRHNGQRGQPPGPCDADRKIVAPRALAQRSLDEWRTQRAVLIEQAGQAGCEVVSWLPAAASTAGPWADRVASAVADINVKIAAANTSRRRLLAVTG